MTTSAGFGDRVPVKAVMAVDHRCRLSAGGDTFNQARRSPLGKAPRGRARGKNSKEYATCG